MLFWVSYMLVICIFVFALVQHSSACFTWKGAVEIHSLLLLLLPYYCHSYYCYYNKNKYLQSVDLSSHLSALFHSHLYLYTCLHLFSIHLLMCCAQRQIVEMTAAATENKGLTQKCQDLQLQLDNQNETFKERYCLLVGCLTSQRHASVSQG